MHETPLAPLSRRQVNVQSLLCAECLQAQSGCFALLPQDHHQQVLPASKARRFEVIVHNGSSRYDEDGLF